MSQRDLIWRAVRGGHEFSVSDIVETTRAPLPSVRGYVHGLARAGLVERVSAQAGRATVYRLTNDTGIDAPRYNARLGTLDTRPKPRTRIWHAARVMRRFSAVDLATTAETAIQVAHRYIQCLNAAGYLRQLENYAGAAHRKRTYALVRDPGPYALAYCVATHTATDPNTGEVFAL